MDYRESNLDQTIISLSDQAIVPSYRFDCCGRITEWGLDVHPGGGRDDHMYTLDLQVWRPSPTVKTSGCYSKVGNNTFTSVSLSNDVAMVTPLPQDRIDFQPGDVLGFSVIEARGTGRGVVVLHDSQTSGDGGYETEEVWYGTAASPLSDSNCPYPVGSTRVLNTNIRGAPVMTVSYSKLMALWYYYIN